MKTQLLYTLITGMVVYMAPMPAPPSGTTHAASNGASGVVAATASPHRSFPMATVAWESKDGSFPRLMADEEPADPAAPTAPADVEETTDGGFSAFTPSSLAQNGEDPTTPPADQESMPLNEPILSWETPAPSGPEALGSGKVSVAGTDLETGAQVEVAGEPATTIQAAPTTAQTPGNTNVSTMPEQQIVSDEDGFWIRGARLNDVFQYLARLGKYQYFHNAELEAPNYIVTGHLQDGDPLKQMEELGLMYGITIYLKGTTVYAMTEGQLATLPTRPFQYNLKYLRPGDIDQIKTIFLPVLTPGTGTVDYEQKTNTLIVIDNEQKIEAIQNILAEMDRPKRQIAIETKILRVRSTSGNRIGVDWSTVLGEDGLTFEAETALNALFNLPEVDTVTDVITSTMDSSGRRGFTIAEMGVFGVQDDAETELSVNSTIPESSSALALTGTAIGAGAVGGVATEVGGTQGFSRNAEHSQETIRNGSGLVLSPLQLQATLRALNFGGLAQQESSPTLITEDNEQGIISIIDRVPIIITTVSETSAGQNISEEVRYRIDEDDPVDDPALTREIGVSVAVTPTILPDNTIRMRLRPRAAQIVDFVIGQSGNAFPRVNESTVETIARVPNGYSLLIGGFYEENEATDENKVPILGDIPWLGFFFKSSERTKVQTSLVFVVTPTSYEPVSIPDTLATTKRLHDAHVLPRNHAWPDRKNPGFNYEPNLGWAVGNAVNLYPDVPPSNTLNPDHPIHHEGDVVILEGPEHVRPTATTTTVMEAEGPLKESGAPVEDRSGEEPRQKGGLFQKIGERFKNSRR